MRVNKQGEERGEERGEILGGENGKKEVKETGEWMEVET